MKKKIAILGSTGSIGKTLINLILSNKNNFDVVLLTANKNYKTLLKQAEKLKHLGHIKIPEDFSYHNLASISFEAKQKLTKIKPKSIDQASRVSGVSPSDISVLLVYMGR